MVKKAAIAEQEDDLFENMPQGFPGRKSFVYLPTQREEFWRDEALQLRKCFIILGPIHTILIFLDIFVHDWNIFWLLTDILFAWFCYYNYMTLNKVTCFF